MPKVMSGKGKTTHISLKIKAEADFEKIPDTIGFAGEKKIVKKINIVFFILKKAE